MLTARQKSSAQILEQELKEKDNRIKQLEKEHSQYKGYQKAVLFQEKELQEARSQVKDLKQQLDEREKLLQQQKGKISIHAKELAEAKADLQEANSIIGIHRANIESLKNELSSLKGKEKLILAGEEPESDQVFSINAEANGIEGKAESSVHLDSKLSMLMQKLKQNERELLMKSRELEKANESRAKVAKYTRSLLQELESKLSSNERKLAETESQLVNKNLELDYEIERRQKVEGENARLFSELELLSEERKKGGLPKEVVELLSTAKKRVALENVEATSTVVQLSQSEPKFDDEQYELSSSEELANLRKDLRKLEDKNADLVEKNRELEERLQTVDSELTESLEREIFLQTESETDEGERWNVKEQIVGLEEELSIYKDKVSELQAKISEKELNAINAEVSQSRLNELERLLKSREDELREKERTVAKLEQEHRTQEEAKRDDKLRLEELENKLRKLQDALESERKKLHAKERELREQTKVMVFREDVERHVGELESELEQKNNALSEWKSSLAKAKDRIAECEEKLREYESGEANRGKAVADDEIFVRDGQGGKDSEDELRKKLTQAEEQIKKYESFAKDNNSKLIASEEKVIELAEELAKRLTVEKETAEWIEGVESNLSTREEELLVTRENLVHKAKELDKEKNGILEVMELSVKYIKELEIAVMEERENSKELERQLDDERLRVRQVVEEMKTVKALQRSEGGAYIKGVNADKIEQRLAVGERNREGETDSRQTELEDSKQKFIREELKREASSHDGEKLNKDLLEVSGTASLEAEELRLRLTSRVITLQSDISELKASHHVEVEKMRAQHKNELEKARREAILDSSVKESITEDNADMESRVMELESDLKQLADR